MNGRAWTESELNYLRDHYPAMRVIEIACELRRTPGTVQAYLCKLGLRRSRKRQPAPDGFKHCPDCDTVKAVTDFHRHTQRLDGLQDRCRRCSIEYATEWNKRNQARFRYNARTSVLRKKYGLERADFAALLVRKQNRCPICGRDLVEIHVDHDHASGLVRGILCPACNKGLGHFGDSPELLARAHAYLTL